MSTLIHPKAITVDGLSVRYAEGGQDGPDAILMSPWPEIVYTFEPAAPCGRRAHTFAALDGRPDEADGRSSGARSSSRRLTRPAYAHAALIEISVGRN
jgi:hypothetical protein